MDAVTRIRRLACRLRFLGMIGAAYLVLLQSAARAITPPRPSIVLIMADDLGYRSLGYYGNHDIDTPHIDRLAANGMRLTDFHSNGPMCSPTRAALMTGRYQQRCRWVDDSDLSPAFQGQRRDNVKQRWAWGISPQESTVAVLLQHAGYRTVLIGNWHLGYDRAFHPMNYGFDEFHGFVGGAVDYHTHIATHGLQDLDWWRDRTLTNDAGYSTDLLTRYATEFIDRHKAEPFFLYVAHAAPHVSLQGRNPAGSDPPAATYREMIEALDDSVGAIVSKLGEHDLSGNTIVVFCSDNGADPPGKTPANGPLRGEKGSVFEVGTACRASWYGQASLPTALPAVIPP